jgi:hypothetical protein
VKLLPIASFFFIQLCAVSDRPYDLTSTRDSAHFRNFFAFLDFLIVKLFPFKVFLGEEVPAKPIVNDHNQTFLGWGTYTSEFLQTLP